VIFTSLLLAAKRDIFILSDFLSYYYFFSFSISIWYIFQELSYMSLYIYVSYILLFSFIFDTRCWPGAFAVALFRVSALAATMLHCFAEVWRPIAAWYYCHFSSWIASMIYLLSDDILSPPPRAPRHWFAIPSPFPPRLTPAFTILMDIPVSLLPAQMSR